MKEKFQHEKILVEASVVLSTRRLKLKQARIATGKSPEEIAAASGITISYYDLEEIDGELNRNISLGELLRLASTLGIRTRFIFDDDTEGQTITPAQLCVSIRKYLYTTGMSIKEFEDRVGFVIEPSLRDNSNIFNWNIDCLRFVCAELGIDWHLALP